MVAVVEVDTEDDDVMKAASISVFNSAAKGAKVGGLDVVSADYDPKYVPAPTNPNDVTCEGPDGAVKDGWSGPSADGCNTCSCSDGALMCTERGCRNGNDSSAKSNAQDEELAKELANARQALKAAEDRIAQLEADTDAPQGDVKAAKEALQTAKEGVTAAAAAVAASKGEKANGGTGDADGDTDGDDDSSSSTVLVVVVVLVVLALLAGVAVAVKMATGANADGRHQNTFDNPTYQAPSFADHAPSNGAATAPSNAAFEKGPRDRMDSVC